MRPENPYTKKFLEVAIATQGQGDVNTFKFLKSKSEAWQNGFDACMKWLEEHLKRTDIGEERSMPNNTEIWFLTKNEWQELKQETQND